MFENYINEIQKEFQKTVGADVQVYSTQEMLEIMFAIKKGEKKAEDVPYPFIILNISTDYASDVENYIVLENGKSISHIVDYTKELPLAITVKTVIYALDVQDIIHLEEMLQKEFSQKHILHSEDGIEFDLKLADEEIIRGKNKDFLQKELMFSSISFNSQGAIDSFAEYHPAEVAFDSSIQKNLLKQVITMLSHKRMLEDKLDALTPDWFTIMKIDSVEVQGGKVDERWNDFVKKQNENYEKSQNYQPGPEEESLKKRISQLHTAIDEKLCLLIPQYNDKDFRNDLERKKYVYLSEYLHEMEENGCDIKKAIELFAKRKADFDEEYEEEENKRFEAEVEAQKREEERQRKIKEEAEEKEFRKKLACSKGDPVLNHYLDAVVKYFQDLFQEEITIYGGSNYCIFKEKVDNNTLSFPHIVIADSLKFTFDEKFFYNLDKSGHQVTYCFSTEVLPTKLGLFFMIRADNQEQIAHIETVVKEQFKNERAIFVPDMFFPEQKNMIILSLSEFTPNDLGYIAQFDDCVCKTLLFEPKTCAYYYKKYSFEEVQYNRMLQIDLLRELEFITESYSKLTGEAINQLGTRYRELVMPKGTIGAMISNALMSAEYKSLKADFQCHRPIERNKFNKALKGITDVYPALYDKMMLGWSLEQIRTDMETVAQQHKQHMNELYEALRIPETISLLVYNKKYLGREPVALRYYIDQIAGNNTITIDRAINLYRADLIEKERKKEEDRRARAEAARYEQSYAYESPHSSSSGGGILETAIGTAIGTHGVKKELKKQNQSTPPVKSYKFLSVCQRAGLHGKSSCAGCTMAPYCTDAR